MSIKAQRYNKRQKRLQEKRLLKIATIQQLNLEIRHIQPITDNQVKTFQLYDKGDNLLLHGCAGTGKTFISLYLALKEIENHKSRRQKVVIIRSAQPSKDIGFLPGTEKQKVEVYEAPYKAICAELYHRDDAYDILKQKGVIEFHSTSFLRGTTIDNAVIIIDECQNARYVELRTVLTRTGDKSRVVLCGDTKQDDLTSERYKEISGLSEMIRVFSKMNRMSTIEFGIDDIVRSGFVRDFIIAEHQLGL